MDARVGSTSALGKAEQSEHRLEELQRIADTLLGVAGDLDVRLSRLHSRLLGGGDVVQEPTPETEPQGQVAVLRSRLHSLERTLINIVGHVDALEEL